MAFGFKIEAWGDRALFTRPELKAERMSYDVPTPSAARGLIESIYWHPGLRYHIDRIHVLNPISFTSVKRNELASKASAQNMRRAFANGTPLPRVDRRNDIQQRSSLILTDVHYVIEGHFDLTEDATATDSPAKFASILNRRASQGKCYSTPYFGTREFPAHFKLYEGEGDPQGFYSDVESKDLGLMLYDMDYSDQGNITPMFFRAVMRHGVIDVAGSEVFR